MFQVISYGVNEDFFLGGPRFDHNSVMTLRVLILEDDPFTRLSVAAAIRHFGFEVVVEEESTGKAVRQAAEASPDVAVLDLHLGNGPTGLDVALELRKLDSKIGIVLLTSYDDPRLLGPNTPKLPPGTVYLNKSEVKNMSAIRDAVLLSIEKPKLPALVRSEGSIASLTDSQVETLRLIAQGLSNAEIAKRKFMKERSVAVSVSRIAKTLGVEYGNDKNLRVKLAREYFRALGVNEVGSGG